VKQTKQNIPKELDFTIEAQNTETIRSMFKHFKWLKVFFYKQVYISVTYNIYKITHLKLFKK